MVLKVYGSAMSTARVLVTILEKGLPYEHVFVDIGQGEHKTEDFKQLQPFGKVPVLDDDGFVMFESRAICRYLDEKYPNTTKLVPKDVCEEYAKFEQACSVEQSYFAQAAETIGTELVIKQMKGLGPPDEGRVAQAEADLDFVLSYYDKILADQKYLAGNKLTLADLFHLPNGAALKAMKWAGLFEKYPHVNKWFEGLQQRESWVEAAAIAKTFP